MEKARRLRKVVISEGSFSEVDASRRPSDGCAYELARLRVGGSDWWTLALEAFGRPDSLETRLRHAGDWFFARSPPGRALTRDDSCAYPSWLAGLRSTLPEPGP